MPKNSVLVIVVSVPASEWWRIAISENWVLFIFYLVHFLPPHSHIICAVQAHDTIFCSVRCVLGVSFFFSISLLYCFSTVTISYYCCFSHFVPLSGDEKKNKQSEGFKLNVPLGAVPTLLPAYNYECMYVYVLVCLR